MSVIHLTQENFEKEVIQSKVPVLVDFWATWCGPCKMMAPVVEEIANEVGSKAKVGKLDVDENQDLAIKYGIMSIPTFVVFENGKVKNSTMGMQDKSSIMKLLSL